MKKEDINDSKKITTPWYQLEKSKILKHPGEQCNNSLATHMSYSSTAKGYEHTRKTKERPV